jgi:hypothetical protein
MASFDDAIHKMLWPERREQDPIIGDKLKEKLGGTLIERTKTTSYIRIASGYVPDNLRGLLPWGQRTFPSLFGDDGLQIGPIPKDTPVSLLANLELVLDDPDLGKRLEHDKKLLELLLKLKHDLKALGDHPSDEDAKKVFANLVQPLMEVSKCPDYIVNRGHYFGTSYFAGEPSLSDDEKNALIEFLKTF